MAGWPVCHVYYKLLPAGSTPHPGQARLTVLDFATLKFAFKWGAGSPVWGLVPNCASNPPPPHPHPHPAATCLCSGPHTHEDGATGAQGRMGNREPEGNPGKGSGAFSVTKLELIRGVNLLPGRKGKGPARQEAGGFLLPWLLRTKGPYFCSSLDPALRVPKD